MHAIMRSHLLPSERFDCDCFSAALAATAFDFGLTEILRKPPRFLILRRAGYFADDET